MACAFPDNIVCLLCFEELTNPRRLPCYHSFDEKCLQNYIKSHRTRDKFHCPVCRMEILVPKTDLTLQNWACSFPVDDIALCAIEAAQEETVVTPEANTCDMCRDDGETPDADYWCTDCQQKLCSSCRRHHQRMNITKNHAINQIQEQEPCKNKTLNFSKTCSCDLGKMVEYYCVDHKQMCCEKCAGITTHRQCQVRTLDQVSDDFHKRNFVETNVLKDMEKMEASVEKLRIGRENSKLGTETSKKQISKAMNDMYDGLVEAVNKSRKDMNRNIDQKYSQVIDKIKEGDEKFKCFRKHCRNLKNVTKIFGECGNNQQQFIVHDMVLQQLESHYTRLKTDTENEMDAIFTICNNIAQDIPKILSSLDKLDIVHETPSENRIRFIQEFDRIFQTILLKAQINRETCAAQIPKAVPQTTQNTESQKTKTKGALERKPENTNPDNKAVQGRKQLTTPDRQRRQVSDAFSSQVEFITLLTSQNTKRDNSDFTGVTILSDGRLLLADFNNKRIVELDSEYKYVRHHGIDGHPYDIAVGKDMDVYITVYPGDGLTGGKSYDIYRCRLSRELKVVSRTKCLGNLCGMAVNDKYIVTSDERRVRLRSHDDTYAKSFVRVASSAEYVALSPRGVYYADGNNVVCWSIEGGNKVFRYKHKDLCIPYGICTDSDDNAYVCGWLSGNVHQISPDGETGRIISLHSIKSPKAIVYNPRYRDIIITSSEQKAVLEVLRLK